MKVLYYAHQHGSGHCKNAEYIGRILNDKLIVVTSSDFKFSSVDSVVRVKPEHERQDKDILPGRLQLPNYLHYSPVGNSNILDRSYTLLKVAKEKGISFCIIDLSVEVASLVRAASIPFAYVRLPGHRNDIPHLEAYRSALFLLAYYPKELEDANTLDWVKNKTIYLGFLIDKQPAASMDNIPKAIINNKDRLITVVKGYGGSDEVDTAFVQFKKKHPELFYLSLGPVNKKIKNEYDFIIEFSPFVHDFFRISQRIIAPASLNLTAEILLHNKAFTVVECDRPFDEQKQMSKRLIEQGYADSIETGIKTTFKKYQNTEESVLFLNELSKAKSMREFYFEFIKPMLNED